MQEPLHPGAAHITQAVPFAQALLKHLCALTKSQHQVFDDLLYIPPVLEAPGMELRHFGIEKLKQATAEEISSVEGIGPKLAENIVDFFAKLKKRGPQIEDEQEGDLPENGDAAGPVENEAGEVTYQLRPSRQTVAKDHSDNGTSDQGEPF